MRPIVLDVERGTPFTVGNTRGENFQSLSSKGCSHQKVKGAHKEENSRTKNCGGNKFRYLEQISRYSIQADVAIRYLYH